MPRSVLVLAVLFVLAASSRAQEAIFLVRHAERADSSNDSPLASEGQARAIRLAEWLRTAGITHIYTTDLQRTIETARPFASASRLSPQQVPASDTDSVVVRVSSLGRTARPLIVGHSNTIPILLGRFHVEEPVTIGDSEYDNIFVVVPRENAASVLLRFKY